MTRNRLAELNETFRLLGDPTRLAILDLLMQGVQCNCELGSQLKLPLNLISHHLKMLRNAGWINAERDPADARWIYYSLNAERLSSLRAEVAAFLDPARVQTRVPQCGPQTIAAAQVRPRAR